MHDTLVSSSSAPLSVNQDSYLLGEWFSCLHSEPAPPFVTWFGVDFPSEPDVDRLRGALTRIVNRHAVFRMSITDVGSLERSHAPQVFAALRTLSVSSSLFRYHRRPPAPVRIRVVSGSMAFDPTTWSVDSDEIRDDVNTPFRYDAPPLMRVTLVKTASGRCLLSITLHHLISDRRSMLLLLRELAAEYQGTGGGDGTRDGTAVPLPPLAAQYSDFAVWQRSRLAGGVWDDGISYWRKQWAEFVPSLMTFADIPYRRPTTTSPPAVETRVVSVAVDAHCTTRVRAFCRQRSLTPYVGWLAALMVLCRLYGGRDRVALFTYQENRQQRSWMDLIGWFVNSSLCGLTLPVSVSGAEVVEATRAHVLAASRHQMIPMGTMWRRLIRDGVVERDFAIREWATFDFFNVNAGRTDDAPWSRTWLNVIGRRQRPELGIIAVDDGDDFTLWCRYPTSSLSSSGARRLLTDLCGVMEHLTSSQSVSIDHYAESLSITRSRKVEG